MSGDYHGSCYVDADSCLVCPEQPYIPFSPPHVDHKPVIGWNAGANSLATIDGDLHMVLTMPKGTTGALVGLKGSRSRQTLPSLIEHGWYFQSAGGADVAQVVEGGSPQTALATRLDTDSFEIRRQGADVIYLKNGTVVHNSTLPSLGPKLVNACLYASGDHIGEGS